MKKIDYYRFLWRRKYIFIFIFLFFFFVSYFFTSFFYNKEKTFYVFNIRSNESLDLDYITSLKYFDETIKSIEEHNKKVSDGLLNDSKISYAKVDLNQLVKSLTITTKDYINYKVTIKQKVFPTIIKTSTGMPNFGKDRCYKYFSIMYNEEYVGTKIDFIKDINGEHVIEHGKINEWIVSIVISMTAIVLELICCSFLFIFSKDTALKEIYDNEEIFKTPFHKKYWIKARNDSKGIKSLTIISLLFAMMLISKLIPIPSGFGSLGLGFSYLFFAVICMLYGPIIGLEVGLFSDILGFFIFPTGYPFFPGYTLDAMLSGLFYGLFLYRSKLTFMKCFYVRVIINLYINVIQGSIWWAILYKFNFGQWLTYVFAISLPKNLVYLLPQSILLFMNLKLLSRFLASLDLIDKRVCDNISLV